MPQIHWRIRLPTSAAIDHETRKLNNVHAVKEGRLSLSLSPTSKPAAVPIFCIDLISRGSHVRDGDQVFPPDYSHPSINFECEQDATGI